MDINDYLIAQPGIDWRKLLSCWTPPLPSAFDLWLVNRLGDIFGVLASDAVFRLDVGSGTYAEVARSREEFARLLNQPHNADEWLKITLVQACRQAGMTLTRLQCYGFKISPTLGGRYEVSNLVPTDLAVHYSYQAYICKQTDVYWIPPPA
jgi:hypothetical protein